MSKNVLSVIYFFPPMGGSGVQRTLKFVRYMPEFGYNPIVETIKEGHNFAHDETLLKEVAVGTGVIVTLVVLKLLKCIDQILEKPYGLEI